MDIDDAVGWEHYKDGKFWHHAVAGASAGVCEHLIMYPFDTIKTNLQAERPKQFSSPSGGGPPGGPPGSSCAAACPTKINPGTSSCTSATKAGAATSSSASSSCAPAAGTSSASTASSRVNFNATTTGAAGSGAAATAPSSTLSSTITRGNCSPFMTSLQQRTATTGIIPTTAVASSSTAGGTRTGAALGANPGSRSVYSNTFAAFRAIKNEAGWSGFYRGVSAMALGCVPAHIGYFCAYETVKGFGRSSNSSRDQTNNARNYSSADKDNPGGHKDQHLPNGQNNSASSSSPYSPTAFLASNPWLIGMGAGCAASFAHDLILTPLDVAKQRMQLRAGSHTRSCAECVKHVVKTEGYLALYRSFPVTLFSNVPFSAILVGCNEQLKEQFDVNTTCQTWDEMQTKLPMYFTLAGVSSGVAAVCTQPLDVIKTRIQTQTCLLNKTSVRYHGIIDAARTIYAEEGLRAFFRGSAARALVVIPSCAISWASYETIKSFLVRNDF
ncbi:unnamed protein product [Amoebophrya sp. A120]|nr:unnamed protein product [Amoebophrya sp. A120]|eukprot:GSA120T00010587001.1